MKAKRALNLPNTNFLTASNPEESYRIFNEDDKYDEGHEKDLIATEKKEKVQFISNMQLAYTLFISLSVLR